jgi:hypothetical protein
VNQPKRLYLPDPASQTRCIPTLQLFYHRSQDEPNLIIRRTSDKHLWTATTLIVGVKCAGATLQVLVPTNEPSICGLAIHSGIQVFRIITCLDPTQFKSIAICSLSSPTSH